jgi:putative restriction endonuclease
MGVGGQSVGYRETRLLDVAPHTMMDAGEELGLRIVTNGLPLSKIHQAAFDANLVGIDPDYRINLGPTARTA